MSMNVSKLSLANPEEDRSKLSFRNGYKPSPKSNVCYSPNFKKDFDEDEVPVKIENSAIDEMCYEDCLYSDEALIEIEKDVAEDLK